MSEPTDTEVEKMLAFLKDREAQYVDFQGESIDPASMWFGNAADLIRRLAAAKASAERERDDRAGFMRREGYRECSIAACNCNSWHGGHASDRLMEIADIVPHNGVILKDAIAALVEKTRQERIDGNWPRAFDLNDPAEHLRLLREVAGYLHTCRREHHGTDFSGRMHAIAAVETMIAEFKGKRLDDFAKPIRAALEE